MLKSQVWPWAQWVGTGCRDRKSKEWLVPVNERPGFEGIKGQVPSRTGHQSSLVSAWVHRDEDTRIHMHPHAHQKEEGDSIGCSSEGLVK